MEKEKSRENITSEESSNTSEQIHEEISENLDDEKKDITEDKSTDLDQVDIQYNTFYSVHVQPILLPVSDK